MKSHTLKFLDVFVGIGIALTIFALALIPLILTASLKQYDGFLQENPYAVTAISGGCYLCALPFILALFRLKKICSFFKQRKFFAPEISEGFKKIAFCAFAEAIILFIVQVAPSILFGAFMYALTVIPAFVFPFVCITIGLLSMVMSIVFREATEIKNENDAIF